MISVCRICLGRAWQTAGTASAPIGLLDRVPDVLTIAAAGAGSAAENTNGMAGLVGAWSAEDGVCGILAAVVAAAGCRFLPAAAMTIGL